NNKVSLNKSLIDLYFKNPRSWANVHRINLSLKQKEFCKEQKTLQDIETFSYYIKVQETGIELKGKIPILSDIYKTDIITWIENFRRIIKKTKWKDNESLEILKNLIPDDIFDKVEKIKNLETCMQTILQVKYNKNTADIYLEKIKKIKQENYINITDYIENQDSALGEYFIAKNYNKHIQEVKIEEIFFEGLTANTLIYLSQHNITEKRIAVEKLKSLEQTLETIYNKQENENKNKNHESDKEYFPSVYSKSKKVIKWCPFHKSSTHKKEECFALKKMNKNTFIKSKDNELNKENSNYIVFEASSNLNILKIPLNINNNVYFAVVDTGATNSFISDKILHNFHYDIHNDITNIILANGTSERSNGKIKIPFTIGKFENNHFEQKFSIVKNLDNDFILGLDFLKKEKILINLDNMNLVFHDFKIKLENDEFYAKYNDPDNSYFYNEKLNILKEDIHYKKDIENLISTFSSKNIKLGKIPNCKFKITLKEPKIIKKRPYQIPYKYYDLVKKEIKSLIDQGIIKHSNSDYSSPAFPIVKRNGEIRLVVDFRALNNILDDSGYPFPEIWDHIHTMKGKQYFSQIDITKGFHNIEIHKSDQHLTSFVLPWGQYEYTRIPFGIKTAPRFFQSIISSIFRDLEYVKIFIDDLLISSDTIEEHYNHLKEVIKRLDENNISVNFNKSNFFKEEVIYLGNKISRNGIQADIRRVDSIKLKMPNTGKVTSKKIKSIIGSLEWFRPFISNLSSKINKLHNKTKKNGNLIWKEEDNIILENIISNIKENTLLVHPNLNEEFILECDASNETIGAALKQNNKPIGFFSKSLNKSERNYSITEKEMLAIYKSLNHFKRLLLGSKVVVYTDHNNLIYENNISNRVNKWKIILMDFNYKIKFIKGSKNVMADNLSRLYSIKTKIHDIKKIKKAQSDYLNEIFYKHVLVNGVKILVDEKQRVIIPFEISHDFLKKLHLKLNHPSNILLYNSLKKFVHIDKFMKILNEIKYYCLFCQQYKNYRTRHDITRNIKTPERIFKTISSDIYGPFNTYDNDDNVILSKNYILTITDHCSRYTSAFHLNQITSKNLITFFIKWFKTYGIPKNIITDNGKQYTSTTFENFLLKNDIIHIKTSPYNPQSNGISERINQSITRILNCNRNKLISNIIKKINFTLRNSYNRMIGYSPNEIIFNYNELDPLKREVKFDLNQVVKFSDLNKSKSVENMNKIKKKHLFNINDFIFIKNDISSKEDLKWKGPFRITQIRSNYVFIEGKKEPINFRRIRPWVRG
ncbi:Transposon Tf2-6 polyprotein, partial [Dictyocoela muelleri]